MRELLIGCGKVYNKLLTSNKDKKEFENLTTLDNNPEHNPDILHDLTQLPLPFEDDTFDEIHAYEVLEHLYSQGDYKNFFKEFTEYHRILKPNGYMFITVPAPNSVWALGDPSHTRIMPPEHFHFLSQKAYVENVKVSPMSDFRYIYKADFSLTAKTQGEHTLVMMRAIKS